MRHFYELIFHMFSLYIYIYIYIYIYCSSCVHMINTAVMLCYGCICRVIYAMLCHTGSCYKGDEIRFNVANTNSVHTNLSITVISCAMGQKIEWPWLTRDKFRIWVVLDNCGVFKALNVTCFSNFPLVDTCKNWYTLRVKAIIEKYEKKYRGPRLNFLITLNYVIYRQWRIHKNEVKTRVIL